MAEPAPELVSIGVVAAAASTNVKTVRYYDEIGLVAATERVGGKRRFEPSAADRVIFIRRAQEVGFTLEEVREILDDDVGGWRKLVAEKLADLRERRTRLDDMIALLGEMQECGCRDALACVRSGAGRGD